MAVVSTSSTNEEGSTSEQGGSTGDGGRVLLIANRGEIARRVARTARAEGWRTIAIYTDLDAEALHVAEANAAVRIDSYLDVDEVVAVAREAGATHVHPGYGFLSERAAFPRALAEAGITLVGPTGDAMDAMGRKDAAREIAIAAGVPVVPAYDLPSGPDDPAIGTFDYPVLVKAAAGGGGKGMRVVRSAAEFSAAADAARRESVSSFGDDTLLVEKYVQSGRHIEVQVLADHHGNVVHLFERDCSTQRRHQKVLEEAPAPTITPEQRDAVTNAAVALTAEVGYTNAGTVEFLLDTEADPTTGEGVYFLEMNTRLQVEHPVTEEVVRVRGERLDLVALQLRVATGEPLGFSQDEVALDGHSIEARVYAEDSFGGFLPQAGTTTIVRWPSGVRVDHALESGQVVSTSYDPMLGKVIAQGPDRESTRQALVDALDETFILGLTTNTGFLRALVASDEFRDATIDTAWLDRHEVPAPGAEVPRLMGAWESAHLAGLDIGHPFEADGFRLGAPAAPVLVELDRMVEVDFTAGRVDQTPVRHIRAIDRLLEVAVDGVREKAVVDVQREVVEVVHRGQRFRFERPDAFGDQATDAGDGTLIAPMPGTVLAVGAEQGQQVSEGDVLVTLEAMKMELSLKAPFDGTVTEIDAIVGEQVKLGARLVVVESGTEDETP